jgi:hypothetical protein
MVKATIYFSNDPTVGISPAYFTMELPFFSKEAMQDFDDEKESLTGIECVRNKIKKMYEELDGESFCHVWFDFEY